MLSLVTWEEVQYDVGASAAISTLSRPNPSLVPSPHLPSLPLTPQSLPITQQENLPLRTPSGIWIVQRSNAN